MNDFPTLEEMMEDLSKTEGGQFFLSSILPFLMADPANYKKPEEQEDV